MLRFNTAALIDQLQQQTESFLQKATVDWQMISPARLLQPPSEKKWSVAQCLDHLNSYGRYYLPAIEEAIQKAKEKNWAAEDQFVPGWLGNYFTALMAPDSEGKKMKKMSAPKNHIPVADLDSDRVLSEFIDQQEKMLQLLEDAKKVSLGKSRVSISIAKFIQLKLGDTFRFLTMHTYRHLLQAERALQASEIKGELVKEHG
jgi:hypothetical protein